MSDSALPDRSTYTLVVHRLTYAELWRLANHNWFGFLLLVQIKLTKSTRLDHTHTSAFVPTILQPSDAEIPTHALDRLTSARAQYADLGFRYLGIDAEVLHAKSCLAYFVRGPVFAYQAISPTYNFVMLLSYPPGQLPVATANGRSPVDNTALYDSLLLPKARIATTLARHLERIAAFNLPDLSEAEVLIQLEQNARKAQALQIARGVFVPQPLAPLPPAQA